MKDSARAVLEADVREQVNQIGDPCSVASGTPMGLTDMGLVERVDIEAQGKVQVHLRLTSPSCYQLGYFTEEIITRVSALDGVESVEVHSDKGLDWTPDMMSDDAKRRRREHLDKLGIQPLLGG